MNELRQNAQLDWTFVSPAIEMHPGIATGRTGQYRLGTESPVFDAAGRSFLSVQDLAVAVLDEVEKPHFRVAGYPYAAHFGHYLRLLPAIKQFGAAAQLLRGGLRAAAFTGQAQGRCFERIIVLTPLIWRGLALFCSHDSRNIRPASVRPN
ncbi:hypothetical protein BEN49_05610 [Hymenobacter coccineus]|uniref:NAD(P)-binding domain-containing protein n=1 Tax=Hymenobacter coccineus TaxID=1908235 RepID=A0A1G1TJA6_9BACT|nr:hypothetical protein [Hymenobacter coccineus]OGX90956.1 hypothetical protein BEN49_05610 [Hymenobacter coccineus]